MTRAERNLKTAAKLVLSRPDNKACAAILERCEREVAIERESVAGRAARILEKTE